MSEAKIGNLDRSGLIELARSGHQQVVRFDIAMDNAMFPGVGQAQCRLPCDGQCLRRGQLSTLIDVLSEILSVDQFHRQEDATVVLT